MPSMINNIDLKYAENGKVKSCTLNGVACKTYDEGRGAKSKFWIETPNGEVFLVKYNEASDNQTLENAGQLIMNSILNQVGQKHAEYYPTTLQIDGVKCDAIMSKNFKPNNYRELSGITINQKISSFFYDNFRGREIEPHHTVYYYINSLQLLYRKKNIDLVSIKKDLLKYAIMQYVFCMTDLHYYNVSFMFDENKGISTLEVSPFYDCGNICGLNQSQSKIRSNYENLLKTRKQDFFIEHKIVETEMPMFGVKHALSINKYSNAGKYICRPKNEDLEVESRIQSNKQLLDNLKEELTISIMEDPELMEFYDKIKTVDFEKIRNEYSSEHQFVPEYALDTVKLVAKSNMKKLDKVIKYARSLDQKYGTFSKKCKTQVTEENENDSFML